MQEMVIIIIDKKNHLTDIRHGESERETKDITWTQPDPAGSSTSAHQAWGRTSQTVSYLGVHTES